MRSQATAEANAVARGYGWKDMVRRFGFPTLSEAVERVCYPGLDLSGVIRHAKLTPALPHPECYWTSSRR